mgnify:CR=1 FL=1|jgi:flagellar biogenesis protein FliO
MAKTRSIALHCCSSVICWLSVRTVEATESTPLPLPSDDSAVFSMGTGVWRVVLALAVVVIVILVLRRFVARASSGGVAGANSGKLITIVERKPLGPRQSLLLVQVGDKKVLLHQAKGALVPLCELDAEDGEV